MTALPLPTFGSLLRQQRLAAGLTQEELAERAGLSSRAIIALELGERRKPYRHTLGLLSAALQLSSAEAEMLLRAAGYAAASRERIEVGSRQTAPPLVGRSSELAALDRFLASPGSPVLLVTGEPGIGKSRLLQEAARAGVERGYTVLQGGGQRRSGQEPYAPLLETLARSLRGMSSARLRTALAGCGWLVRLLPELVELVRAPVPAGTLPPHQERRLVFAAVGRYMSNIAGPAGTMLVLDDLQWSSSDGLDLLMSLSQPESGIRVLGAYRDVEAGQNLPLLALLSDLAEHNLIDQLTLEPLSDADAMALLDSLLTGRDEHDQISQRIVRRAGGLPFFLVSCVHDLEAGVRAEGVPWTVAQSVRRRVAALPEPAREALQAAAILGRASRRSTILRMVKASEEEVFAGLDAACRAHLLLPQGKSAYRFAHDVVREAIDADLGDAQRVLLHQTAAAALESSPESKENTARRNAELAWHFREGDQAGPASFYSIKAGDAALALSAYDEAEWHYRSALELACEAQGKSLEAEAGEKLGNLLWSTARFEESLAVLQRAAVLHESAADLDAVGRVAGRIGWTHSHRGTPVEGIAHLEPLAARLVPMGPTRGLVDVYNALYHLYLRQGRYGELANAAQGAFDAARAVSPDEIPLSGDLNRGLALFWQGKLEEALEILLSVASRAEEAHDDVILCRSLMWAKNSCEEAGLFVRGIDCAERAVATTERMENPTFLVAALRSQGELMSLLGRWREARACVERAVEVASSAASWAGDAYLALAEIAMAEGNGDEVAVQVGLCSETSTRTGARGVQLRLQCLLAKKDLLDGKPALALARLDPIEQELRVGYGQWALEQTLAEARMETGDVTSAAEMVRKGIERSRRGNMRLSLAIWLRLQGMLATRQARWEDGLTALNEALALMEQMPYPYGEAEILHETGQLLAARDERDQARTPFEHALALFRRLGARPYAEKTERELAELRSRV